MELDFYNWMMVFVRMSAFLFALPFFSAVNFPVMMRIGLAALSAMLLGPLLPPVALGGLDLFSLSGLFFREISIGLLLGFMGRIVFFAADIAGVIIAQELGLSMAAIVDPTTRQQEQMPSLVLSLLAIVTMLTLDLHHGMLLGFAKTFEVLPIGSGHLSNTLFEYFVAGTAHIFSVALQMAAPVMAVSFVITLFFAVMSRAVPQMNVFAESFGVRIAGGLIVFGFTLQIAAQYVANHLRKLPDDLMFIGQMLNGG